MGLKMNFVLSIAGLVIAIVGCVLIVRLSFSQQAGLSEQKISAMIEEKTKTYVTEEKVKEIIKEAIAALKPTTSKKEERSEQMLPKIKGKKVVMIIARNNFRDEELEIPKDIFEKQGAKVTIASSSLSKATGMLGLVVKPDILLSDVKVEDYDAVIFVGGSGASEYWNNQTAHSIAKKTLDSNKLLCAICIAPVTLANAGVLKGRKATVWPSEKGKLGSSYTGASVEIDGNIITADGPASATKFAQAIVSALSKK